MVTVNAFWLGVLVTLVIEIIGVCILAVRWSFKEEEKKR